MRIGALNAGFKRCHDAALRFGRCFNPTQHLRAIGSAAALGVCDKVIDIEAFASKRGPKNPIQGQTTHCVTDISNGQLRTL